MDLWNQSVEPAANFTSLLMKNLKRHQQGPFRLGSMAKYD
jgi:hypothetical protein